LTEHTLFLDEISPLEFYGVNNGRFRQLKDEFPELMFVARGHELKIRGPKADLDRAAGVLDLLVLEITKRGNISEERFQHILLHHGKGMANMENADLDDVILHGSRGALIRAKTEGQKQVVKAIDENDIVFVTGPAGTGKTYTAVAMAVKALKEKQIKKIVLVRPAVEAGETLGFLPGDLKEKLDPYLRPLYDSLEDMLHFDKLKAYTEKNVIEIAPLAYMRGRTLSNAFVILDEGQNATETQFKMFLTRLGRGSKMVVTGDDSQIDLPRNMRSGLRSAMHILKDVEGIAFIRMQPTDVMRHVLVKRIIGAYDVHENALKTRKPLDSSED
jgi:phosphate starvation-inducible PhoH-like protein